MSNNTTMSVVEVEPGRWTVGPDFEIHESMSFADLECCGLEYLVLYRGEHIGTYFTFAGAVGSTVLDAHPGRPAAAPILPIVAPGAGFSSVMAGLPPSSHGAAAPSSFWSAFGQEVARILRERHGSALHEIGDAVTRAACAWRLL